MKKRGEFVFNYQEENNQEKATEVLGNKQVHTNGLPVDNSNQQESQRSKNGLWINQLPKSLRGNFDGEDMPTVGDLARDYLRLKELEKSGKKEERPTKKYQSEQYEAIKKYFAQGESYDGRRDNALFQLLVESDVDPDRLAKILDERPTANDLEQAKKNAQTQFESNLKTMWGEKTEENKALLERAIGKLDEETKKELESTGENYSPIVADLLVKLEQAQTFGNQAKGTNTLDALSDAEKMWGTINRK